MGEGNNYFVLSEVKSSGNLLFAFYRKLPMGRKDTGFGVKQQKLLVGWHLLKYEYMVVETPIYIRYVVITIIILRLYLPLNYFILQNFVHVWDVTLSTYLSFFLTGLQYITDKV